MFWRRRNGSGRDDLDTPLLYWTQHDPLTVRDLLNGGVLTIGRTGSGKTSSSGKTLARKLVSHRNSCGLISAAKPEDVGMWRKIFADAGRSKDLLTFDATGDLRFNFLAEAMQHGGHTREITRCIMTIGETLRSGENRGRGEDSQFWEREQERMIYNAVQIIKLANGTVTAPDLQRFITTAALAPEQLRQPEWQTGFHSSCLQAAFEKQKRAIEAHDCELATQYWLGEFPNMSSRTRSSILVGVLGLLHVFNTGLTRELVSTTTNVSPDDMLLGRKWILINMPPATYGDIGRFINAGWKYLTQKRVLRREAKPGDPIHVCWCDEASQFCNSFDSSYVAQSRSHLGCLAFLSQSLSSFYTAFGGDSGKHQAQVLLSNFGHRIVHALGDHESAEWASELLGKQLESFFGGSTQPAQDIWDCVLGTGQFTGSFNSHYEHILQPNVFMNGLRTGGKLNGYVCDAVVIRSGEPFSNGQNFLQVAFSQR
jgi:TraM recognition site of TraD and TraG